MKLNRGLAVFLAIFFLVGMISAPVRSLLPVYVESALRQPPTLTSTVLAAQLLVAGLFAVVGGVVADGVGQRRALLIGLAGLPLASAVYLSSQPGLMAALVALRGATEGLQVAGSQAYLVAGAPSGHLGVASALYFLGGTLGSSLGNLAAGWIVTRYGFGTLALVLVAGGLGLTLAAARLLGDPGGAAERKGVRSGAHGYGGLLRRREVQLLGCVRFLPTFYWGVMTLLMPLLIFRLSGDVMVVSAYASASLLLAAGCQLLTGRVVDTLSRTAPPRLLTALIPVCAALAALAARSLPGLFAVGVLGTCVAWSLSATLPPLVREVAGPAEEGRILGFLHLLWSAAMLVGTVTAGALVDLDPAAPFALAAALNLPAFAAAWGLAGLIARRRAALPVAG